MTQNEASKDTLSLCAQNIVPGVLKAAFVLERISYGFVNSALFVSHNHSYPKYL